MKSILFCVCLTFLGWGFAALLADQAPGKRASGSPKGSSSKSTAPHPAAAESKSPEAAITFPRSEAITGERAEGDWTAIQAIVKEFTRAFNAHDAEAVTGLFMSDAELIDESGQTVQSRPAIQRIFRDVFARHPEIQMQVRIDSVRFLGKVLAIEEGNTTTVPDGNPEAAPEVSRYVVNYVKHEGEWKMASARDLSSLPQSAADHLKELEWLVGTWIDENGDSLVATTFRWSDDKHFLLSDFTIQIGGGPPVKGTQRIGWDPRTNELRSWTFDSDGGFGEAVWTHSGNRWISKTTGVTHDGRVGSATNILTQLSPDLATYQSRDRIAGGVTAPDILEIPIVRQPPPPTAP